MPEPKTIVFSFKEIAEVLIREANLHEGLWGLLVKFGITGANIGSAPEKDDLRPSAIVPILELGIQRFDEPSNLTVDASVVNPKSKPKSKPKAKKK